MDATFPARRTPLSQHPAFASLVALWLAALLGGCATVLPYGQLQRLAAYGGTSLQAFATDQMTFAATAGILGGLAGWILAALLTRVQRRLPRNLAAQAASARPAAFVERLIGEFEQSDMASFDPVVDDRATVPRHGKAVQLMRKRSPAELAMPLLVERFAVALDEHRHPSTSADEAGYAPLTPPTDLAFELYALRSQLHRAALARADSPVGMPSEVVANSAIDRE